MEQESSSSKSLSNSNKRRQSFTDELHDIVNSSSSQDFSAERETRYSTRQTSQYQTTNLEGAPNYSQSRQTQFSRSPSQGEMLSQLHGANVDLSAAYFNFQSRDQQIYQANRSFNGAMMTGEELQHNEMMNRYSMSISNMHPQFHLMTSSSINRGAQIGSSQTLVPFESSGIDAALNINMHNTYSVPLGLNIEMISENLDFMRPMRSQGFSYPLNTPNGYDISNNVKSLTTSTTKVTYDNPMSGLLNVVAVQPTIESPLPIRPVSTTQGIPYPMNIPTGSNGPSTSSLKRKAPSQDGTPPNYQSWNSNFGRGLHRYSSSCNNGGRYSLYDKRYEDVGLPVDPHLRIFIATNGNGNGDSASRKRD